MTPEEIKTQLANQQDFLNELWKCYENGIKVEKLDPKLLFIALIDDLIVQIHEDKGTVNYVGSGSLVN